MKVVFVGAIDDALVRELRGRPAVVLVGTMEEVRQAGGMLYARVEIRELPRRDAEQGAKPK